MEIKYSDIAALKKIYIEMFKHQRDPKLKSLVEQNRKEIDYNLKLFEYTEESFAKENSFCIKCGHGLNRDNKCRGCQKEYGW